MIKYGSLTLSDRDEDGTLWVISCEKDAKEVEIPLSVDGMPVVGIAGYAFEDCTTLRRIGFPEADADAYIENEGRMLSVIEEHAFMGCTSLEEITLPDTVITVGHGAFHSCTALQRAEMPSDPYLAPYAFYECAKLSDVTPTTYPSEGVFSGCVSLTALPLTEEADEIAEDAFEGCGGLTSVTIPKNIRRIEGLAFRGSSVSSVEFESPEGWVIISAYSDSERPLDLSDPVANAEALRAMDFDDGVIAWEKR